MSFVEGFRAIALNDTEAEEREDGVSRRRQSYDHWEWGTVNESGQVVLDSDVEPLPDDTTSLIGLIPGQRVRVDRQGTFLCIAGGMSQPVRFGPGENADSYTFPGAMYVEDPTFVSSEYGLPDVVSAGWLEILGDGLNTLQRFTAGSTGEVYSRTQLEAGSWTSWRQASSGGWKDLLISSPWESYSAFGVFAYRVEGDVVRLSGSVRNGTGTSAQPFTTLPVEARPRSTRLVTMATAGGGSLGYITSAGLVYLNSELPPNTWVSVEGVTYRL